MSVPLKKKKLMSLYVVIVVISALLFVFRQKDSRHVASLESGSDESVTLSKMLVIHNLKWAKGQDHSRLSLYDDRSNLCDVWSSLQVTFRGEGLAFSGEPSRVIQTTLCESGGFYQDWPHDLKADIPGLKKLGFMGEAPPEWALETVQLMGPQGTLKISGPEVYENTGALFSFE